MYRRNATRTIVWVIGLALVIVALFMLFMETGLSRYVPLGIAIAGLLLIVGVAIMGFADRARGLDTHHEGHAEPHRTHVVERTVVEEPHGRGGRYHH